MVQFSLSFIPEPSWSFSISLMIAWKTSLTDYKTNINFYHKIVEDGSRYTKSARKDTKTQTKYTIILLLLVVLVALFCA